MNIQSIAKAAYTAMAFSIAMPAAAHGAAETVTPNFQHAIPNIPGKSLTAVVVDYAPGAAYFNAQACGLGLHLCLCRIGRDRFTGR